MSFWQGPGAGKISCFAGDEGRHRRASLDWTAPSTSLRASLGGCPYMIFMPAANATSRFSDRVENYVRYRPGYPPEALRVLQDECGIASGHVVADVASGTGIWTRMLLENGNRVIGVEPNAEMRQAGERLLAGFPRFTSVAGTAEATTLDDGS